MDEQVVLVKYFGKGKNTYAYFVPGYLNNVAVGDLVVVQARDTLALARVASLDPEPDEAKWASKFVVDIVDIAAFNAYCDSAVPKEL